MRVGSTASRSHSGTSRTPPPQPPKSKGELEHVSKLQVDKAHRTCPFRTISFANLQQIVRRVYMMVRFISAKLIHQHGCLCPKCLGSARLPHIRIRHSVPPLTFAGSCGARALLQHTQDRRSACMQWTFETTRGGVAAGTKRKDGLYPAFAAHNACIAARAVRY